ncbi:MAG: hypothetical protein ACE14M_05580 [Terriglobales bacterium]
MNARDFHFEPPRKVLRRLQVLAGIGAVTFLAGLIFAPQRAWVNLLLVSYYGLGVALGGAVFIAVQYVSGAAWSVALRRVPEAMAAVLPLGGIGLLAVLLFRPSLYSWTNAAEAMPAFKRFWLDLSFFRGRAVLFLLLWMAVTWLMLRSSRMQDEDGDFRHTRRNIRLSAIFLVVFGVTYSLASYDWIMSLEPHWASTLFGMYNFAGLFVTGTAVLAILLVWLQRGPMNGIITSHHVHDVGKLVFAFSTFWMYLWFSQYMLIWYANIPEETVYYIRRLHGFWQPLFLLDMVLNWVVPFLALLPRTNKKKPGVLVRVCVTLLVGRWLDLYLMIAPPFAGAKPQIGIWELGLMAGAVGVFALGFLAAVRRAPLVPVRDPHLGESLHYHA